MALLLEVQELYPHPEKIKIQNPGKVESILQTLVESGPEALQVITDFDYTLTKFKNLDGTNCHTCHGVIDHSPLVPASFREKTNALKAKYYPIEIDPDLSVQEKIPYMVQWYQESHQVLAECKMSKAELQEMVNSSNVHLRDEAREVLAQLHNHQVPVLVFSAGIGDILENVLRRDNVFFPNTKVISNYLEFGGDDRAVGFKKPLIHMFNKNETAVRHSQYFNDLLTRPNAILLGDSLGDANMHHGMPTHNSSVLKIGFLNDKIKERTKSFMDNFDIVVPDDQTFAIVRVILSRIFKKK